MKPTVLLRPAPGGLIIMLLALMVASCVRAQTNPVNVANVSAPYGCAAVAVSGKYVYAANDFSHPISGLSVFDMSNPSAPINVGYQDGASDCRSVVISGEYAYAVYDGGLRVLSLSNPTNPVIVGHIAGFWVDVTVSGHCLYLSEGRNSLAMYDIRDPEDPIPVGHIDSGWNPHVAASGQYAYVADNEGRLLVWDVSELSNPVNVAQGVTTNGAVPLDLEVAGQYLYVGTDSRFYQSFLLYDISNPTNPIIVHRRHLLAQSIDVAGNYAYLVCGVSMVVLDVSDATNLFVAASLELPCWGKSGHSLSVSHNIAYIANVEGLSICSLGIPASPPVSIRSTNTNTVLLSWPMPAAAFAVEQLPEISTGQWVTITNTPIKVGLRNEVSIAPPNGSMFYRLHSR